jgi:hypothetical protein
MLKEAELLALRTVLADHRGRLLDRLATDAADRIEPGFLRLLADLQTAIAAIDAELDVGVVFHDPPNSPAA